ncbi:MAG: hypothetical protein WD077_05930 [Bacteroidia bacterium]
MPITKYPLDNNVHKTLHNPVTLTSQYSMCSRIVFQSLTLIQQQISNKRVQLKGGYGQRIRNPNPFALKNPHTNSALQLEAKPTKPAASTAARPT